MVLKSVTLNDPERRMAVLPALIHPIRRAPTLR